MSLDSVARAKLEADVGAALLEYLAVSGTTSVVFPIPNTSPQIYVAAGELETLIELLKHGPPTVRTET